MHRRADDSIGQYINVIVFIIHKVKDYFFILLFLDEKKHTRSVVYEKTLHNLLKILCLSSNLSIGLLKDFFTLKHAIFLTQIL